MNNQKEKKMEFYMNVNTGSVDSRENWESDSEKFAWDFEDEVATGNLRRVVRDPDGEWISAE